MTIRVLIVDDHPVVRSGIAGMIETDPQISVCAEAGDGTEALAYVSSGGPVDVILTDLRMPRMDGVELIRKVHALGRDTRVVVLTTYDADADILHAVEAGASGYLLKDAPREQIIESIKAAALGETALSPRVAARLVAHVNKPSAVSLTGREREILTLVAQGYTNQKIARILAISISTVKTHLERSYEKLGVSDRASAVSQALARGLISLS